MPFYICSVAVRQTLSITCLPQQLQHILVLPDLCDPQRHAAFGISSAVPTAAVLLSMLLLLLATVQYPDQMLSDVHTPHGREPPKGLWYRYMRRGSASSQYSPTLSAWWKCFRHASAGWA
ncbi:hypothetical protein GSI_07808 [Ganoderma sinense ZZ0214-1]|uniref:Uncharacterized protein n=1 Tax=Ganoderma sinense ZZ0214-1 TaxID=1077348 RepID=A0A2G8S8P6_9APHY|nr:hypothetical protein GSI_07808 [Ganoderma sinense ZZ0214-1]